MYVHRFPAASRAAHDIAAGTSNSSVASGRFALHKNAQIRRPVLKMEHRGCEQRSCWRGSPPRLMTLSGDRGTLRGTHLRPLTSAVYADATGGEMPGAHEPHSGVITVPLANVARTSLHQRQHSRPYSKRCVSSRHKRTAKATFAAVCPHGRQEVTVFISCLLSYFRCHCSG